MVEGVTNAIITIPYHHFAFVHSHNPEFSCGIMKLSSEILFNLKKLSALCNYINIRTVDNYSSKIINSLIFRRINNLR